MSDKIVEVRNRDSGTVGYTIKDLGIWRNFSPKETKKIPLEELKALQYAPGGEFTLKHLLMINDKDALSALNIETEPEYFYTEKEIEELLLFGTLDQLRDCLDFAPQGVIELIKKISVNTELSDIRKRDIIFEKTGFNINNAITVNKVMNEPSLDDSAEDTKIRRAAPITGTEATPTRRTQPPKYKVVVKE